MPVYRRLIAMTAVDGQCAKEDSKIDEIIPNELEVGQPTDLDAINSSSIGPGKVDARTTINDQLRYGQRASKK